MPSEKARSLDHFYELLATGQHPKIELDFDVAADDFFKIATEFGESVSTPCRLVGCHASRRGPTRFS